MPKQNKYIEVDCTDLTEEQLEEASNEVELEFEDVSEDFVIENTDPETLQTNVNSILAENTDLDEKSKMKISSLIEVCINEGIETNLERYKTQLDEEYEEIFANEKNEIIETVNKYLTRIAEDWSEENKIAIRGGIRESQYEKLVAGIQEAFASVNLETESGDESLIDEADNQIQGYKDSYDRLINENDELRIQIEEIRKEQAITETLSNYNLNEVQEETVRDLFDKVSVNESDYENYKTKLESLIESFVGKEISHESSTTEDCFETYENNQYIPSKNLNEDSSEKRNAWENSFEILEKI